MSFNQILLNQLYEHKLMCIFRVNEIETSRLVKAAQACVDGGARFIEITYNHEAYEDKTLEVVKAIKEQLKDKAYVGVGTVLNLREALRVHEAGADFIVAPTLNLEVLTYAKDHQLFYMPGVFTATEAYEAYAHGVEMVKLFPTGEIGLDYALALMKPMGFIKYFAVGKMTPEFYEDCLKAGFAGAGVSSSINQKDILMKDDFDLICQKVKHYVEISDKYKS